MSQQHSKTVPLGFGAFYLGCSTITVAILMIATAAVLRVSFGDVPTRWKLIVAEPLLRVMLGIVSKDQTLLEVLTIWSISIWIVGLAGRLVGYVTVSLIGQPHTYDLQPDEPEKVQDLLRQMDGDDAVSPRKKLPKDASDCGQGTRAQPRRIVAGCALMFVLLAPLNAVVFCIMIAFYFAVDRVLIDQSSQPTEVVSAATADVLEHLREQRIFGVRPFDRSLLLTGIVAILAVIKWFLRSLPTAVLTLPTGASRMGWIGLAIAVVSLYFLLKAALLYVLVVWLVLAVLSENFAHHALRPARLRANQLFARIIRRRQ